MTLGINNQSIHSCIHTSKPWYGSKIDLSTIGFNETCKPWMSMMYLRRFLLTMFGLEHIAIVLYFVFCHLKWLGDDRVSLGHATVY